MHSAGAHLLREYLLRVDADHPKHIDDYIDYVGTGQTPDGIPGANTSWGEDGDDGASGESFSSYHGRSSCGDESARPRQSRRSYTRRPPRSRPKR